MPLGFLAHDRTAVPAHIVERSNAAVLASHQHDWAVANRRRDEVADVRDLRGMRHEKPVSIPNAIELHPVDVLVEVETSGKHVRRRTLSQLELDVVRERHVKAPNFTRPYKCLR